MSVLHLPLVGLMEKVYGERRGESSSAQDGSGPEPGHGLGNSSADINKDAKVDIGDLVIIAKDYGKTYPY